jgi:hypothetical protein
MAAKKGKKIKVQDLKPKKDAKGGVIAATNRGGHLGQTGHLGQNRQTGQTGHTGQLGAH